MGSLVFNYLFGRIIVLMMLAGAIYILKKPEYSKFERIIAKFLVPTMSILLIYIFTFSEGLTNKIKRFNEIKNLNHIEVDSIIYESDTDKIKILNRNVIENLVNHYNEMESTFMVDGRGSGKPFVMYLYIKDSDRISFNNYYNSIGTLVIELPGVGEYSSEGLGYYMTKEYLSTPDSSAH